MPNFICLTCGAQHAASEEPPDHCIICEDERQYVGAYSAALLLGLFSLLLVWGTDRLRKLVVG